jgi:peptidase M15-like protein
MRRLSTVALGVALCTLATAADAQPGDATSTWREMHPHYADGYRAVRRPRAKRRALARYKGTRYAAVGRTGRRASLRRSGRRYAVRTRRGYRSTLANRSFTRFARGGTARTCLTSPARALLARIEEQFGPVRIISTCRPGAVIAGSGRPSRHASGNAIDFNAPAGRKPEVVRWLIANHRSGGVMTYAAMNHIHVDIGRRFVALNSGGARRWR